MKRSTMGPRETTYDWKSAGLKPWAPGCANRDCSPTDAALYLAIAYVQLSEGTYDDEYVKAGTVGFERLRDYVLGYRDGIPKRPQWAAPISGVPSYTIKALARRWGEQAVPVGNDEDLAELVTKTEQLPTDLAARPRARNTGLPPTLIGGTVYDYEVDEVIEGALVTIQPAGRIPDPGGARETAPAVATDECGCFLVDRPEQGPYLISIEKEGYLPLQVGPIKAGDDLNLRDFAMCLDSKGLIW
jgi:hypothetical protein